MEKSALNESLSQLMKQNRVSLAMLNRNTGIPFPTLKRLSSDPTANPTITTLIPIAQFFRVSIDQLIGKQPLPTSPKGYLENAQHWIKIPIIKWKDVPLWPSILDQEHYGPKYVMTDIDAGDRPFALEVLEDDWIYFLKGSFLIINPDLKPEHKDFAVVYKKELTQPSLKKIIIDEDRIYLKPLNPELKPVLWTEDYQCFGILVQVRNNIREGR